MTLADSLANLAADPTPPDRAASAWQLTMTSAHADVQTGGLEEPIVSVSDWDGVLRHFGLDPAEFCVVDDTVRMSRWQQSKGLDDGTRSTVWLHSYSARFRRVTDRLPAADVEALRDRVHKWKPVKLRRDSAVADDRTPSTFYVGWADWQLGKGSLEEISARVEASVAATVVRIAELRKMGRRIDSLCIANMGDPIEGCMGSYDSQLFTVQATKREQLNAALDLWWMGLRTLAPLFDDVQFVSVLSNHGEWTRPAGRGGKALTSDSDNADAFLAETLRRIAEQRPDMAHVRWVIPHDEMSVVADLSGVPCLFAHGHKAPGTAKELEWLRGQAIRLMYEGSDPARVCFTAHRHHLRVQDYGAFWLLQHPTLEAGHPVTGGSKWYTDSSGLWSTPGTLTAVVGPHDRRGWSDLAVL